MSIAELRRQGAYGFPGDVARTHCDDDLLRVQSWNDESNLVVQAILWFDGDDGLGETSDGRKAGDRADLVLDVHGDQERTVEADRTYMLNPWPQIPGMYHSIPLGPGASSHIQKGSKGRGSIGYVTVDADRRVRVDTFVIPFAEIETEAGKTVGLAYVGDSTVPDRKVNSIGYASDDAYYTRDLPFDDFHRVTLSVDDSSMDIAEIHNGRSDRKRMRKPKRAKKLLVGAVPPPMIVADWMNTDEPPTFEGLRGKVVLIDFWATWCAPCIAAIPHLNELQSKYSDQGLVVIGITDQSKKGVKSFGDRMKYAVGCGSEMSAAFGAKGLPHAFLIGRDGKLAWEGNPNSEEFESEILKAIEPSAKTTKGDDS